MTLHLTQIDDKMGAVVIIALNSEHNFIRDFILCKNFVGGKKNVERIFLAAKISSCQMFHSEVCLLVKYQTS